MHFTPTFFITQLLAAMQVLMTLDMPLSTTMALPVTSKPIESTVENLAWQAWIDLPPEQKQQVKSRKVTPKSIFTLPNRIECPEGHKQVDTKCIPLVIGTNANLIAPNYLTIIAGNSPTDEQYDYDDVEEVHFSFNPQMQIGEADKSVDGLSVELKPPSKDEPLKFNIFENKFNIFHEEPFEDYLSSISNEASGGSPSIENESSVTVNLTLANTSSNSTFNITAINDLVSESTTVSESNTGVTKSGETITTQADLADINTLTTLKSDNTDFKVNAISLPASGFESQISHKLSMFQDDPSLQLITTIMDSEAKNQNKKQQLQLQEHDMQTLLQTDSLLPLILPATATTLLNSPLPESSALTAVSTDDHNESFSNSFSLNIGDEEQTTTIANIMEQEMEMEMEVPRGDKVEYTRSVTLQPLIPDDGDTDKDDVNETTLKSIMNDEPLDTTTTIQLDDTTIIENIETATSLSVHSSPADSLDLSTQQDLKELLIKQEQALKDFEELQRMRKGQKDQQTILKKSKVEPVEVLSPTTTATTDIPRTTATTMDELITAETVTPLLTVHNENDNNNNNNNNNDRFYYQHYAKHDLEETLPITATEQHTNGELKLATATPTEIEAMPATKTSEIDLSEELRLINELVKGITPAKVTNIKTKMHATTTEIITTLTDVISSSSSPAPNISESSAVTIKPTLTTSQIWSQLMPLLKRPQPSQSSVATLQSSADSSSVTVENSTASESSSSNRSHRNSKIIRINGFNNFSSIKPLSSSTTTTTTTTTTTEDPSLFFPTSPTAESYWWLPVAWRLDKSVTTEKQQETEVKQEEQPLLLRFWSAYHAPKSS